MRHLFTAAALGFTLMTAPAFAAEPTPIADAASAAVAALEVPAPQADFRTTVEGRLRRPAALPAMYAASVALQGYDAYSTLTVLKAGGVEANPISSFSASRPLTMTATRPAKCCPPSSAGPRPPPAPSSSPVPAKPPSPAKSMAACKLSR